MTIEDKKRELALDRIQQAEEKMDPILVFNP